MIRRKVKYTNEVFGKKKELAQELPEDSGDKDMEVQLFHCGTSWMLTPEDSVSVLLCMDEGFGWLISIWARET